MREATSAIRGCYSGRPGGANNPRPPHPCAVIAGLREAGTRYIRAAGPGPRNLCQAQLTRRDGVGWDPSPPPRPRNPFRSCLHQRQGFSPSTVSIDHILHGLKRACSLGQGEEDRVNDTLQSALVGVNIVNKHPAAVCTLLRSQNISVVLHGGRQDMTTGATGAEHVVYLPPLLCSQTRIRHPPKTSKGSS